MIYGNQNVVKTVPIAVTYDASVSASTELVLNAGTTILHVTAITAPILLNWGADDASTTVFDGVVSPNQSLYFYVPIDPATKALFTAVNFIQTASDAILIVEEY